jgi:uncharacterized protein (UPF0276 family)
MKFALNYSPQAAALLNAGRIDIDLYKCPDWPHLIQPALEQRPVYVHFPLIAGRGGAVDWAHIDTLLESTATPYLNTHLAPHAGELGIPLDTRESAHAERLVEVMIRDIEPLVARYGAEAIILENAIWDIEWNIPLPVLQPALITRVVNETGCGFLLDTAHAAASARFMGVDERDYINQLPVDRLRELHVTGLAQDTTGVWVDHFEMTSADWDLFDWSMVRIHSGAWAAPWVVSFEYGGVGPLFETRSDSHVIAEQVPRLYGAVHAVEHTLSLTGE